MALKVKLDGIVDGHAIDPDFCTCRSDGWGGVKPGGNRSPSISWSGAPRETKSFALIVVDRDVPADFSPANKVGLTIPSDAERKAFYHWLLVHIPADVTALGEGEMAGIAGHNSMGERSSGSKGGANGYDGPCPPFNDERVHTYHFIVYALDVAALDLQPGFSGEEATAAISGHILDQSETTGKYTTNPHLHVSA